MIKALGDLPAGVIGFESSGKLEAQDYKDVLIPAIEHAAEGGKVRVVVVIDDFGGLSGGALWEDLKLAAGHLRSLTRFVPGHRQRLDAPFRHSLRLDGPRGDQALPHGRTGAGRRMGGGDQLTIGTVDRSSSSPRCTAGPCRQPQKPRPGRRFAEPGPGGEAVSGQPYGWVQRGDPTRWRVPSGST